MPNELSEKVYPDGTVVKLRDDTAREQIDDINDKLRGVYKSQITDFNDLPKGSIMQVYGSAAHAPGTSAHYYIVFTYFIAGTTTYKLQLAIENSVGSVYTRDCTNDVWGSWKELCPIDRVAANSFNSSEDITSSDSFICPKDGYVSLVLANGASGTVLVGGRELMAVSSSQGRTVQSVFVKAGMSVRLTDASGTKYLYYEPLQY